MPVSHKPAELRLQMMLGSMSEIWKPFCFGIGFHEERDFDVRAAKAFPDLNIYNGQEILSCGLPGSTCKLANRSIPFFFSFLLDFGNHSLHLGPGFDGG